MRIDKNVIKSANSAKPSQLQQVGPEDEINALVSQLPDLDSEATAAAGQLPDLEGSAPAVPAEGAPVNQELVPPEEMVPRSSFLGIDTSFGEQQREKGIRSELSFGVTAKEKADYLAKKYGAENVKSSQDKVIFRFPGEKKWRKIDNDTFEVINDIFSDFSRDAMEAGVDAGIRIPTVMTGPVGGAVAGMSSLKAGDLAAKAMGFEKDPARSTALEYGLAGTLGAVLPFIGGAITRRQAAKEASKLMTVNLAKGAARETVQAIQELGQTELGKRMQVEGMRLMPHQLVKPGIAPEAMEVAKASSQNDIFRNRVMQQGEILSRGYNAMLDYMGNVVGHTKGLAKELKDEALSESQFEGKLIGGWRDMAIKESKNKLQPMQNASAKLLSQDGQLHQIESVARKHGVMKLNYDSVSKLDKNAIQDIRSKVPGFASMSSSHVKTYLHNLTTVTDALTKRKDRIGMMPLEQLDSLYTQLTGTIKGTKRGSALQTELIKLKDSIRDDWTASIGNLLGEDSKIAYQSSLNRYSTIQMAQKELSAAFKNSSMGSEALASYLFESESKNAARVTAVKNLIAESDPQLWAQIKGQYMDKVRREFTKGIEAPNSQVREYIDWNGMEKKIYSLGNEVVDDLLEGSALDRPTLNNLITLGKQFQNTSFENMKRPEKVGLIRRLFLTSMAQISSNYHKANESMKFISKMGEDSAVIRYINSGEADKILNEVVKPKERELVRELFRVVGDRLPDPILDAAKVTKMGLKKTLPTAIRTQSRSVPAKAAGESQSQRNQRRKQVEDEE